MTRLIKKRSSTIGLPPGSLVHIGEKISDKVRITVIDYDSIELKEVTIEKIEDCYKFKDKPTITWINIDGIHDIDVIEQIGKKYDIHPLVLEDILHTGQRPKMEDFENYIYIVLKMLSHNENKGEIDSEQVSLILGNNFVISFQEKQGDLFNH